jgi:hypothetical protein
MPSVTDSQRMLADTGLVRSFAAAQRLANEKPGAFRKKELSALFAVLTKEDAEAFAHRYAACLQELGHIQTRQVVSVTWQSLLEKKGMLSTVPNFNEAFERAAGGLLLIREAYRDHLTLNEMVVNHAANKILFGKQDECVFDAGQRVFLEKAEKPVVVLSGKESALSFVYGRDPVNFDMRFRQKSF